jgi:glycolate oxidase FAD binding subunit
MNQPNMTIPEIQDFIKSNARVSVRGGGTKPAISSAANLELRNLSGILEYDPSEYTFTALAGTRVSEVATLLAQHGQHLPFDPPLLEAGATLGGTVAAGLSGSGRQRFGGVRDFVLAVQFLDGLGSVVRGGGKVVKNAAGFDLPKMHCGALGAFGVITELTFKVFPAPEAWATLQLECQNLPTALTTLLKLAGSSFDLECLDLLGSNLLIRIGGVSEALETRLENIQQFLGMVGTVTRDDTSIWQRVREFDWVNPNSSLVKIPMTPKNIVALETKLEGRGRTRHISSGNLCWLGWSDSLEKLDSMLLELGLSGLVLRGNSTRALIGKQTGGALLERVKNAFDPERKFHAA